MAKHHVLFAFGVICGLTAMNMVLPDKTQANNPILTKIAISQESWIQSVLETHYRITYPNSAILSHVIVLATDKEGGDPLLTLAQINTESHFKYWVKSAENAEGYMQVVKIHWKAQCPYEVSDRYQNIFAGQCALRHSVEKAGNLSDGLIVYNIGEYNWDKQRFLKSGKIYRDKVFQEYAQLKRIQRKTVIDLD
jgi:hypothetical protein